MIMRESSFIISLVHELSDERVFPQDLSSEDGVETGNVLILGVA